MKRLIYLYFLNLLFSVTGCVFEDEKSINADEIFIKYYGTSREERAVDLVELKHAGGSEYLILGTRENSADDIDYLLIKTDSLGVRLWERTYSSSVPLSVDIPNAMTLYDCVNEMNCGKVIIAGVSNVDDESHSLIVAVDIDSDGVDYGQLRYQYFANDHSEGAQFVNTSCSKIIPYDDENGVGFVSVGSVASYNGKGSSTLVSRFESSAISQSFADRSFLTDENVLKVDSLSNSAHSSYLRDSFFSYEKLSSFQRDELGVDVIMVKTDLGLSDRESTFYFLANYTDSNGDRFTITEFDGHEGSIEGENELDLSEPGNHFGSKIMYDGSARLRVVGTTIDGSSQHAFEVNVGLKLGGQVYKKYTFNVDNAGGNTEETWDTSGEDIVRSRYNQLFVLGQVLDYKEGSNQILKGSEIVLMPADAESNIEEDAVQVMGGIGDDEGKAMIMRDDGSIVIAATTDFGGSSFMITLIKTNSRGELLEN